jgi:hypothetical protein
VCVNLNSLRVMQSCLSLYEAAARSSPGFLGSVCCGSRATQSSYIPDYSFSLVAVINRRSAELENTSNSELTCIYFLKQPCSYVVPEPGNPFLVAYKIGMYAAIAAASSQ